MSMPPGGPPHGPPPGRGPSGGYPTEPYYAPGWTAPPPPGRRRRRTSVVVGAVVGVVVLALVAGGALRLNLWAQTRELGPIDEPRTANARQLGVGHCIETLPDDGDVRSVRLVPCDAPHEAEVVGEIGLEAAWPGQEPADRQVAAACRMSTAEQEQGLVPVTWSPTEQSWRQGDRTGLCLAADAAAAGR